MKKLSSLLVMAFAATAATQSFAAGADYELGAGRLIFQGSFAQSGCSVDTNLGVPSGSNGDVYIDMPSQISSSFVEPLTATTATAFAALRDEVKRSGTTNGQGGFTLSITCPADMVVADLVARDIDTAATTDTFKTNSKLYFNASAAGQGGFISSESTNNVGVLAESADSQAKNVGVAFLRTNPVAGNPAVVSLTGTEVTEPVTWQTAPDLVGSALTLKADASYDFAYVSTTGGPVAVNGGQIRHIVGFKFAYRN